jgi:oxalate---CoA ligase
MDNLFSLKTLGTITDITSGISWSADEIRKQISLRINTLQQAGVAEGEIIILAHGGTLAFFADLFAVWSLGGCAVCLNQTLTANEISNVANFVKPRLILISVDQEEKVRDITLPCVDLMKSDELSSDTLPHTVANPDDPALILFTSGTTGAPKGVVHTFRSLSERLTHNRLHISEMTLTNTLCVLPTHFGHGLIGNCLTPLSAGMNLFLYQNPGVKGAANLGAIIDEYHITFMSSVASFWKVVLKTSRQPQHNTLLQISVGSAPLSKELWSKIIDWSGCKNVLNMYGITETANWTAGASAEEYETEDGLVGKMWGGDAAIATAEGKIKRFGEGEILLKPVSLMQGYFQRDDLTEEVIQDGWYRTGDWGEIDRDSVIRLRGRTRTEINKAGIKILPEEIDLLLERHPAINEACAFAVPDAISGETVAIAICFGLEKDIATADLRAWCSERIRPDAIPDKWFVVDEIPKTDRGKVNRKIVRDYCLKNG